MTIKIRPYQETDAESAGKLIAATYREYNLSFLSPNEQAAYLGPFYFANSTDESHQKAIAQVLQAPMIFVAEDEQGEIVGILRGKKGPPAQPLRARRSAPSRHRHPPGETFRAGLPGARWGRD
jgi:hypothetical protein